MASAPAWWPRLSIEVEEMVKNCFLCAGHTVNRREPLFPIAATIINHIKSIFSGFGLPKFLFLIMVPKTSIRNLCVL